tara:strand:+ start:718 stop:1344 length:627 start_codon:yes stop_codon:yes gene_type:complete
MKNLIKINLNQTISKAQLEFVKQERIRWGIFATISILFIINIAWLSLTAYRLSNILETRKTSLRNTESSITSHRNQARELQEALNQDTDKITNIVSIGVEEVNILNTFEQNRVLWSTKLENLTRILPIEMYLQDIDLKGSQLNITTVSRFPEDQVIMPIIDNFIKKINSDPTFTDDFSEFKSLGYDEETVDEKRMIVYRFTAKLKRSN